MNNWATQPYNEQHKWEKKSLIFTKKWKGMHMYTPNYPYIVKSVCLSDSDWQVSACTRGGTDMPLD